METKILAVDDSRAVHAFLDRSLAGTSYVLVHALSAREALEALAREGGAIKLILLDWVMPDRSGPEAIADFRAAGFAVPIVMVTAHTRPEDITVMLEAGAQEYIMKPFTPDILIEKIESILGEAS